MGNSNTTYIVYMPKDEVMRHIKGSVYEPGVLDIFSNVYMKHMGEIVGVVKKDSFNVCKRELGPTVHLEGILSSTPNGCLIKLRSIYPTVTTERGGIRSLGRVNE